jgi:pimeloyl-ACP methyl ester carboxylesterase
MTLADSQPTLLIPGLTDSPRLYQAQLPELFRFGPVMVADHTRDDDVRALAARVLRHAPPKFTLVGLSMGGYTAFEIMRTAPERVLKLALLDTSARPETPESAERRLLGIARAERGEYAQVVEDVWPVAVHESHLADQALKDVFVRMHLAAGKDVYIRQQRAIMSRPDSRPSLAAIRCPTLVLVGDGDKITPPSVAEEIANGIAGATLQVIATCGHLSALEQPEAVSDALLRWLSA